MALIDDVAAALSVPITRADLLAAFEAFIAADWTGPAGADGADGADGAQGIQGIQGPEGPQGEPGSGGDPLDAWPVGSIFLAGVNTSPATLLGGGTWQRIAQGKFLVGWSDSDGDFDLDDTGGVKEVTLTAAQSGLPQHTHTQNSHNHTQDSHTHTLPVGATDDTSAPFDRADAGTNASGANASTASGGTVATNQAATAVNQNAGPTDASQAHTNLPPYLAVAMWERTA